MSNVFPKNKEKRSRTSSGESNNSFVKNVTSRVSGLLPATITKWFSSPSSSANGSAPAADATDSSTEDEGPESPITAQPPAKRMRYNSAGYGSADASCVTNNIETIESSTQYTVQSPPGRTTFRRETNFVSTPIRPEETTIDRTTDQTTSRITFNRTTDRTTLDRTTDRITLDRTDKDTTSHTTAASIGLSASKKRKSLFGYQTQELSDASQKAYVKTSNNTFRDPRQPTFKPTLLGSPFYAGKTTYGGAASSYINQPNISQRQSTTVKEAPNNSDNNMSTSARRILELLESYSSPLMDARRIPHYTRPTRQEVLKRHSESSSSLLLHNNNNNSSKSNNYKTQELHVPSIASILRLKQRSRLNDSTNAARQLIASHSSSSPDYLPYPTISKRDQTEVDGNSKLTTKVKTRRTRLHGGEANALDTETLTPVELPKAVLQIDPNNLPNFSIPVASKPSSIDKPAVTTPFVSSIFAPKTTDVVERSKSEKTTSNSIYNFANPVRITSESPKTTSTPPKFTFGSPERSIEKPSEPSNLLGPPKESEKKTETSAAGWNCPNCWVKNKSDEPQCVCCGHKHQAKAAAPAKCTLCKLADSQAGSDKCVNCAKVQVNNIAKPLKADTTAKWSCKECWASNDDASDKCACCGAANPKKAAQTHAVTIPQSGGMCSKCFSTKGSDGTCSKCDKSKDSSFKIVLKSQANKWECEYCLVRNDSDKTKCVCCEAERSGLPKQPEKKQFNFGTINTTFKFGIDPKVQEANLAKVSEKPAETKDKAEESETNNNVLAKAPPTFSFGVPAKKSEDQPDAPVEKAVEEPKATFTFGLPKQSSIAPSSQPSPIFGIPNNLTGASKEPEKNDKPEQKKPEVNDKPVDVKKADEPSKPVMTFGSSPSAGKSVSQPLSAAFILNKDATSSPLSLPASSAPLAPTTESAENTGLFGAVASSAPATSISFTPPASTTSLSMFQKTDEPKTTNTIFQKSEPAPISLFPKSDTSAAAPAPTATSVFSFSSTQAQATDKPSFNFTFGSSNKSDMFKPPTFAATDSSATANKFTLGSTATENPLAPTSMPGGNGLSASNMTSNSLGGNGLSVNPLAAPANPLSPGNGIAAAAPSIFGSVQKDNSWTPPNNSTSNLFTANATTNSAPKPFSFGSSTPFNANTAPAFGANTQSSTPAFGTNNTQTLTPAFGANNSQASTPAFGANAQTSSPAFGANNTPTSTPAFGANTRASSPAFGANNTQTSTPAFGANTQASSPAFGANNTQTSTPAFGANAQASSPAFGANNTQTSTPAFGSTITQTSTPAFGTNTLTSTPAFGANNAQTSTPAFGSNWATSPPAFGASQSAPAPAFGSNVQSTPNIFGMASQNNQPSIFSSPSQNSTGMFGSGNPAGGIQPPAMGMFGRPNVGATPTFGTPNPSIPTFEAPSLPAQAPSFNFGTPQTSFVFGQQQQQQQQPQQTGVYNFGAPGGTAGVQFSMGTAPNQAVRRVRRPARRVSQR